MKISQNFVSLIALCFSIAGASALTPFSDNFNATKLNATRWKLESYGKGKLTQAAGRLNFSLSSPPSGEDYGQIELRNNRPGFNEDWEVVIDVQNTANQGGTVAAGLWIFNAADRSDGVFFEFYGSGKDAGYYVIGITDDQDIPSADINANPGVTRGSMRIGFSKSTKLFTFWYDRTGSGDGFQWVKLTTFSPTGTGGNRRGNWKINPASGSFGIILFGAGYEAKRAVSTGKVRLDNFVLRAK